MGIVDIILLAVFLAFYIGLFYNIPILTAGVLDLRRNKHLELKKSKIKETELPRFSIVVPVKNEAKVIGRVLESLTKLVYPVEKFEIVIIADDSVDGTIEICRDYASSYRNMKVFHRKRSMGKASALNYGIAHSDGDIIAVFDADSVPADNVLIKAAELFQDSKVAAVQGRIQSINALENMLTQFVAYEDAVWSEAFLRGKEKLGLFVHLRGCCEFIRRDALESVGGFNEKMMAEDIEISARFVEQGHRIKYSADIRTWQETPAKMKSFLTQRTRWYRGHMEVAMKYGRLLKNLNKQTLDAELTLCLPFIAIASFFLFSFASWGLASAFALDTVLMICIIFSTAITCILIFLVGLILIYYSKPRRIKSLLWLPFVFAYWSLQSFLAFYAALLILFRRPKKWVKTEKTGKLATKMSLTR